VVQIEGELDGAYGEQSDRNELIEGALGSSRRENRLLPRDDAAR
jgi:hypothetical protein